MIINKKVNIGWIEKLNEYNFEFRNKDNIKGIDALVLAGVVWRFYILIDEFKLKRLII